MSLLVEMRFAACSERGRIVRNGIDTWREDGRIYRESFAPAAFVRGGRAPTFRLHHDGPDVGEVRVIVNHGRWFIADALVEDTPAVREAVKVGAKVSLQARSLKRHEDHDLRLSHHELARLEHIALVAPGQRAGYLDGATAITAVREFPDSKPVDIWPPGWDCLGDLPGFAPEVGLELIDRGRVAYRWNGARFVAAGVR